MISIIFAAVGVVLAIVAIYTNKGIYIIPTGLCSIISNVLVGW